MLALLWSVVSFADPAEAAHLGCGAVVTQDTTLHSDIGPCPGDGLIVATDGITLDLGGHTITGNPAARQGQDHVGIVLRRVNGVTVTNGTVTGFDAGVAVRGGSRNTVRRIVARDNVNYRIVTGVDSTIGQIDMTQGPFCDFGEGIALLNSSNNVVERNVVVGNGPYGGISLIEDSDNNIISKNKLDLNDIPNQNPAGQNTVCGGPPLMESGRNVMTSGIRIEGQGPSGADANLVEHNEVLRSGLGGIAVLGYLSNLPLSNNGDNVIRKNRVSETGKRIHALDERTGHGIYLVRNSGARTAHSNIIEANNSSGNYAAGIYLDSRSSMHSMVVRDNVVNHNGLDGIHIFSPNGPAPGPANQLIQNRGHGNGARVDEYFEEHEQNGGRRWAGVDGFDNTPGCAGTHWFRNRFGTVNQPCVASGGTGWVGGPGNSGEARDDRGRPFGRGGGSP